MYCQCKRDRDALQASRMQRERELKQARVGNSRAAWVSTWYGLWVLSRSNNAYTVHLNTSPNNGQSVSNWDSQLQQATHTLLQTI